MSETNSSGNRWEAHPDPNEAAAAETGPDAGPEAGPEAEAPAAPPADPIEVPAATAPAAPAAVARSSRLPGWVTKRGLVATGAAAAIFIGGGGLGYALGAHHESGDRQFPDRFDRAGFDGHRPDGQFPGGQVPGGGQQNFQAPGGQQGPQTQFQGDDSGTSS